MHRVSAIVLALVPLLVTCTVDQTYTAWFFVSNQTSQDLTVDWGLRQWGVARGPMLIPAGGVAEIHKYERFLDPPPDANAEFSCISVYRASDDQLVYQLSPVKNSQWARRGVAEYKVEFMLILTSAQLDTTLQNRCATLTGVAVDSLSTAPLDNLHVAVTPDDESGDFFQAGTGNGTFRYSLMWEGDLPAAGIRFSRRDYTARTYRLPDDATDLGNRHYELNPALVPAPPPPN